MMACTMVVSSVAVAMREQDGSVKTQRTDRALCVLEPKWPWKKKEARQHCVCGIAAKQHHVDTLFYFFCGNANGSVTVGRAKP